MEGFDACRKIAILSSIALERHVDFEEIYTEGITAITQEDFLYAAKLGWSIKLLASSRKEGNRVYAMVAPALVKPGHPLFAVSDVFNGILVHGNMVDDVMFYGRGAGSHATASAVTADVMEALRHPHENIYAGWSGGKSRPCRTSGPGRSSSWSGRRETRPGSRSWPRPLATAFWWTRGWPGRSGI